MAISDATLLKRDWAGFFVGIPTALLVVTELFRDQFEMTLTDGGTAATAVAESPLGKVQGAKLVTEVVFAAPVAVTANDTNFATITVSKRTAGGGATVVATGNTKTTGSGGLGSLVAFAPISLVLSTVAGATTLADNDELTVLISKGGSGVAFASATGLARIGVEVEPA